MSEKEEFFQSMAPRISSNSNMFKLHRKFNDWNPIGIASVPRKLRSAMNKRNRDTISPHLPYAKMLHQKTYGNGVEYPHISVAKISKWNTKHIGSSDQSPSITKDEEEVVEALYALGNTFPRNKPVERFADTYPLHQTAEICMLTSKGPKEMNVKSRYASIDAQTTHVSSLEAAEGMVSKSHLSSTTAQERSIISRNKKFGLSLDFSVAQSVSEITSLLCKSDATDDTPLSNAANLGALSERFLGTGLAQIIQQKELFNEKQQDSELWPVQLFVPDRKKSCKKCTAHVYISHFIKSFQNLDDKSKRAGTVSRFKPNEGTICGATETNEVVELRSNQNGAYSAGRNPDELRLGIVQDKRLQQPQLQDSTISGTSVEKVQLQLPQLWSNPVCHPPHLDEGGSSLQQHQQHHHFYHQQRMLMAQLALASQCRSRGATFSHFPRPQNVTHDYSTLLPCSQPILPSSYPSDVQDTKFLPSSYPSDVQDTKFSEGLQQQQQQQQLFSLSLASSSSALQGHQNHNLRGGYYDNSSVFNSKHPSNLQCQALVIARRSSN